jgi:hypothetical protein
MSLFVDPGNDETYRPQINRASRRLALTSLAERQELVCASRRAKIEELADAVEHERRQAETFAPLINRVSAGVEPRFDKPVARRIDDFEPSPLREAVPTINSRSKDLDDETRKRVERQSLLRKKLRRVWHTHAESTTMSENVVGAALMDLGLPTDALTVAKFKAALGLTGTSSYVEYERFMKVMEAVLQNAAAAAVVAAPKGVVPRSTTLSARLTTPTEMPRAHPHSERQTAQSTVQQAKRTLSQGPVASRPPSSHGASSSLTRGPPLSAMPLRTNLALAPKPTLAFPPPPPPQRQLVAGLKPAPRSASAGSAAKPAPRDADTAAAISKSTAASNKYVPKEVREARECTFRPQIEHQIARQVALPPDAKGFKEVVDRLARAREVRVPKFDDMLRNGPAPLFAESSKPAESTKVRPFNLRVASRPHDRTKPFLYVDVEMGGGRIDRIAVFHGDTPDALAASFGVRHGLDAKASEKLRRLLKSRITECLNGDGAADASPHDDEPPGHHRPALVVPLLPARPRPGPSKLLSAPSDRPHSSMDVDHAPSPGGPSPQGRGGTSAPALLQAYPSPPLYDDDEDDDFYVVEEEPKDDHHRRYAPTEREHDEEADNGELQDDPRYATQTRRSDVLTTSRSLWL